MPRSVLHINTSFDSGGAAGAALRLHRALGQAGIVSRALAGRPLRELVDGVEGLAVERPRFLLNVAMFRLLGLEGPLNRTIWRDHAAELAAFDVVHLHNAHGYYLPMEILDRVLRRPAVWTLHDQWLATGRRGSRPFRDARRAFDLERLLPFVGFDYPMEIIDRSRSRKRALLDLVRRHRPILICPSEELRRCMVQADVPEDLLRVIPHGVFSSTDVGSASPRAELRREFGWAADEMVLIFVASQITAPGKGLGILLRALEQLPRGHRYKCVVVGGREELVRSRNSNPFVQFSGLVPPTRLQRMMHAADLFVSPTLEESFGLAVVEAAGAGAHVLASDLPVLREVGGSDVSLFPPGDAAALAEQIGLHLAAGPEPDMLRDDRARRVRSRFLVSDWVDRHLAAYRDAEDQHRAGSGRRQGGPLDAGSRTFS